jgi:hypothetical protein
MRMKQQIAGESLEAGLACGEQGEVTGFGETAVVQERAAEASYEDFHDTQSDVRRPTSMP